MTLMFLMVLVLAALACGGSFSTANITEAYLSTDDAGLQATTTFAPSDQVFYAQVSLANAPDETVLKAAWTAVAVEGEDPNLLIDETELTGGDGAYNFSLSNDSDWPVGQYKVDIYLNDELDRTLTFNVQ
jgi:hypothetical protein